MRAAAIRHIRREDVALPHSVEPASAIDALNLRPEGPREEGKPVRLGDDPRGPVRESAGEIEHLVDDRAHARAGEDDAHLVRRGGEFVLEDLDRERVEALFHAETLRSAV